MQLPHRKHNKLKVTKRHLRHLPGVSLLELIIIMAIISVLVGLGLVGLRILQTNDRDTQRITKLAEIKTVVNNYYLTKSRYPASADFQFVSAEQLRIGNQFVALPGLLKRSSSPTSTASETYYYYEVRADGILLCVKRESGEWYNLNTSKNSCP
jgi:type II secretory pathway pseudopilin PulG